jgi:hypothetical protein
MDSELARYIVAVGLDTCQAREKGHRRNGNSQLK